MALNAVVYPQDPFAYYYATNKDMYNLLVENWSYDGLESHHFASYPSTSPSMFTNFEDFQLANPNPDGTREHFDQSLLQVRPVEQEQGQTSTAATRPKRRRARSRKNEEEIENQRMTHIAVERNRRKQMNEYLSALRSIMPESYVQRGDQASIIGGAINFVKELENQVQFLGAHNPHRDKSDLPFSDFFSYPQYSSSTTTRTSTKNDKDSEPIPPVEPKCTAEMDVKVVGDVEVTMVESHANLKVRSKRVPKQLLKFVKGLQTLRLTILHLNVSTVDEIVLYSLSVKVEEDCALTSADEIATAVYEMLAMIEKEAMLH